MASGQTLVVWLPQAHEPPTANPATLDTRNSHPVLDFDTVTQEITVFGGMMPRNYAGGGITVRVVWMATTAVTGTGAWDVAFERIGAAQQDVDTDGFATATSSAAITVPATSGHTAVTDIAVTAGTNTDSIAAGEKFRLRVRRNVGLDSAAGDLELVSIELRET